MSPSFNWIIFSAVMQGNPISETNNASEKTPETISKAVASLPPEQMFELLKQMKQCVQVR